MVALPTWPQVNLLWCLLDAMALVQHQDHELWPSMLAELTRVSNELREAYHLRAWDREMRWKLVVDVGRVRLTSADRGASTDYVRRTSVMMRSRSAWVSAKTRSEETSPGSA